MNALFPDPGSSRVVATDLYACRLRCHSSGGPGAAEADAPAPAPAAEQSATAQSLMNKPGRATSTA